MKIVSGAYGGRRLIVPKNKDIRPTTDKVRGAIFNMLGSRGCVDGAHVLDAFCGTGALGIEALSRGAAHCTFMDKARTSLDLTRQNIEALGIEDSDVIFGDATRAINAKPAQGFDLILLDPPYKKGLLPMAINAIIQAGALSDDAWVMCETERSCEILGRDGLSIDAEKIYGEVKVTLLHYTASLSDHTAI